MTLGNIKTQLLSHGVLSKYQPFLLKSQVLVGKWQLFKYHNILLLKKINKSYDLRLFFL